MGMSGFVGTGLRLSKAEAKRLDRLARATGRSKNSVMRALVRLARVSDLEMLALLRDTQKIMEDADARQ